MKKRLLFLLIPVICLGLSVSASALNKALPLESEMDWQYANEFVSFDMSPGGPWTGYSFGHYLIDNGDGTLSALIVNNVANLSAEPTFSVERYDAAGKLVSSETYPLELPIFGAFLDGGDFFYMACGQENRDENDDLEVWRIVKYDREWNKVTSFSATGGETGATVPFDSTISRMALTEDGKTLALHTAQENYMTGDGLNHQSNITFVLDTETMTPLENVRKPFFVSHSFGQFVLYDGDRLVAVDHGDSNPRAFVLDTSYGSAIERWNLLSFYGVDGDNYTGAVGSGFEQSEAGYLFLGCSNSQDGSDAPWNVFLSFIEKAPPLEMPDLTAEYEGVVITINEKHPVYRQSISYEGIDKTYYFNLTGEKDFEEVGDTIAYLISHIESAEQQIPVFTKYPITWLTDSEDNIRCARLVKMSDSSFAVIWAQLDGLHCQMLNGRGERVGEEHIVAEVPLPPTQPIVYGDTIRWIQTYEWEAIRPDTSGETLSWKIEHVNDPHLFVLDPYSGEMLGKEINPGPDAASILAVNGNTLEARLFFSKNIRDFMTVACAFYDEDGRFMGMQQQTIWEHKEEFAREVSLYFPLMENSCSVKLFVLNQNSFAPVADSPGLILPS